MRTDVELGAALASFTAADVADADLLDVLAAEWRQLSHQQARVWAVMAELANRQPIPGAGWDPAQVFECATNEVRAELLLSRRAARQEVAYADAVYAQPRIADALASGALDRRRAVVLAEACADLTREHAGELTDAVLAAAQRKTPGELAALVRKVAVTLDPAWAERRYRDALRAKRVIGYLSPDGSATITGQGLPVDQAASAYARLDRVADAAKRAGAGATVDQLRAELFLGLLDGCLHGLSHDAIVADLLRRYPAEGAGSQPAAGDGDTAVGAPDGVEIRVGLRTLLGLDDKPAELPAWGPVTAAVARAVLARQRTCEWRFAIHTTEGAVLCDGLIRRRPAATAPAPQASGGIVEVQLPVEMLLDPDIGTAHAEWSGVLAELSGKYAQQRRAMQDPAARFPGRPLRRHSQIRHRHCIFPGCRRPATGCDVDHRRDHATGGATDDENLAPACRYDHMNKTVRGWRLVKIDDRTYCWISPRGRRHPVGIPPAVW